MAHVLVLEIYRDYGMKIEDAVRELDGRLAGPVESGQPQPRRQQEEPANDQALMMLQARMKESNFKGPRG